MLYNLRLICFLDWQGNARCYAVEDTVTYYFHVRIQCLYIASQFFYFSCMLMYNAKDFELSTLKTYFLFSHL
jgi:hypothetical protein